MKVFNGRLYVGANGWGNGGASASEEIRINPDDTWDLVAGAVRTLPDGTTKSPISGLGDGFGNFFTAHMWRAETHNGALYVGTNDASSAFKAVPGLGPALRPEFGFDVWGTCDGQYWWQVTRNAFGDGEWNFGARSIVSTPFGLFIGSTNHVEGTSVWKGDASPCGSDDNANSTGVQFGAVKRTQSDTAGSATSEAIAPVARPARLVAGAQVCGSGLSWDPVDGAVRYRILRSTYRSFDVAVKLPPKLPDGTYLPDQLPVPASGAGSGKGHRVWIAGAYSPVGLTSRDDLRRSQYVTGRPLQLRDRRRRSLGRRLPAVERGSRGVAALNRDLRRTRRRPGTCVRRSDPEVQAGAEEAHTSRRRNPHELAQERRGRCAAGAHAAPRRARGRPGRWAASEPPVASRSTTCRTRPSASSGSLPRTSPADAGKLGRAREDAPSKVGQEVQ